MAPCRRSSGLALSDNEEELEVLSLPSKRPRKATEKRKESEEESCEKLQRQLDRLMKKHAKLSVAITQEQEEHDLDDDDELFESEEDDNEPSVMKTGSFDFQFSSSGIIATLAPKPKTQRRLLYHRGDTPQQEETRGSDITSDHDTRWSPSPLSRRSHHGDYTYPPSDERHEPQEQQNYTLSMVPTTISRSSSQGSTVPSALSRSSSQVSAAPALSRSGSALVGQGSAALTLSCNNTQQSQPDYHYATKGHGERRSATSNSHSAGEPRGRATTTATKRKVPQYHNGQLPSGNPKASDYEPTVSRLILSTIRIWEVRLFTVNTFPDQDQQLEWARECWESACRTAGEDYELVDRILGLVRERGANARGGLRDLARVLMKDFGFNKQLSAETKIQNSSRHHQLLGGSDDPGEAIFHFKDIEQKKGYWQNDAIMNLLQQGFFSKKAASSGMVHQLTFRPLPLPLLAIVIVTEWAEGYHQSIMFTEGNVKPLYEHYLAALEDYNAINSAVVTKLRTKMYDTLRHRAGMAAVVSTKGLSQEFRRRAQEELAGRTGDTDSDL